MPGGNAMRAGWGGEWEHNGTDERRRGEGNIGLEELARLPGMAGARVVRRREKQIGLEV